MAKKKVETEPVLGIRTPYEVIGYFKAKAKTVVLAESQEEALEMARREFSYMGGAHRIPGFPTLEVQRETDVHVLQNSGVLNAGTPCTKHQNKIATCRACVGRA